MNHSTDTTRHLAQRAIDGFAETLACLGRTGVGGAREINVDGLVGAAVPWATDNHWIDAAVAAPGASLAGAPHCVWSTDVPPGRVELAEIAMPCMGLELGAWEPPREAPVETPPLAAVGALNDRAYGQHERLARLIASIADPRVRTHGLRIEGVWACVALTLRVGADVGVQYVATEAAYRRRGLAARVVGAALAQARADRLETATLQASPDGRGVYERLGFRTVATLRASVDARRS
jgi:GNAT superfamily N-acetyltransferase